MMINLKHNIEMIGEINIYTLSNIFKMKITFLALRIRNITV